MNNLFLDYSIPELIDKLKRGAVCLRDLADTVVYAINTKEEQTHAWVCFDFDQLMSNFEKARLKYEPHNYLTGMYGIPFGIKDIFNTRSFPTQMGSPIWKNFTPGNNARVVDSLVRAGGIPAGKTVTAEFAVHSLNETLNPHDITKTPGTSSSGSAAAIAAGMVPFALGSQTAGSIIRPASFCGVWGMKPSFGLIPRTGVLKTTDTLDTIGFLAAHAKSIRVILNCIRVKGPDYPYVYKNVDAQGDFPKSTHNPWRLGIVKTHVWDSATAYAKQAVMDLAAKISKLKSFEVEEIAWPEELNSSHNIHTVIYNKSLAYYFENEAKKSSQISPVMNEMMQIGRSITPKQFNTALSEQHAYCQKLDQLLAKYDVVLSLGTSSSAPVRGAEELPDPSLIWTLGHIPSIAAPVLRCPGELPYGVQFIARRWHDYLLLQCIEELVDSEILPKGSQKINRLLSSIT